ncbi:MAG: hypothetical protein H0T86_04660 [Gemmatimonadales bacterium]|nr:hypothetical protein [Gemmatimonadales bacterium]
MTPLALLGTAALAGLACAERPAPDAAGRGGDAAPATAESLVTTSRDGAQIWLTLARTDSGKAGRCIARAVEIRRGTRRTPVPLLYTLTGPELVNDTTLRARLSDHCAPGDSYLVDLRTGRPVRER